jgi:hypothetical protein
MMLHRAVFKLMVAQFGRVATSAQFGCDATSHHIFSWKLTFIFR